MEKVLNQFSRCDGYNPSVKCDDPMVRVFVHKQFVEKLGDTEDDFVLGEKPVLIEEYNIQKRIQEEAKTTDLKFLLSQLLLRNDGVITGDEPELNVKKGFYGDITGVQVVVNNGKPLVSADSIKSTLPEELRNLTSVELANMSDEEILDYVSKFRSEKAKLNSPSSEPVKESEVK